MSTKPVPGCSILWFSRHGSKCRRNRSQDARFDDFLVMAPNVDETDPRMLDLMIFWSWLQMSTKPIPGCLIWWLSGHGSICQRNRFRILDLMIFWPRLQMSTKPISGSRCRRNRSQGIRFNDFLAMAPDVDGTHPRMLDLMIFWPWPQMSTKPIPGTRFNDFLAMLIKNHWFTKQKHRFILKIIRFCKRNRDPGENH